MEITVELRDKIIDKLNMAYRHFEMDDDEKIARKIQEELGNCHWELRETMTVSGEVVVGCPLSVALEGLDEQHVYRDGKKYFYGKFNSILLLVMENDARFVLEQYESYDPSGWVGEAIYENRTCRWVEPTEISGDYWVV